MNKKLSYSIIRVNLLFLILSISATMIFMVQIGWTLYAIKFKYGHILYNIDYSVFVLKIYATNYQHNSAYIIGNYPLIPMGAAIIYNLFAANKNANAKNKIDS